MTSIRDCYDTEEMALEQNQFRFKDFIDQQTGEVLVKLSRKSFTKVSKSFLITSNVSETQVVYQLEHEIRSLLHPAFQLHKNVFHV